MSQLFLSFGQFLVTCVGHVRGSSEQFDFSYDENFQAKIMCKSTYNKQVLVTSLQDTVQITKTFEKASTHFLFGRTLNQCVAAKI